jgi:hypothetical protein
MSRIDVKIDRVILRGLDPADRHAFVSGLKGELSRALADRAGLPSAGPRRTPVVRLGQMAIEPGAAGARKLGGGIAGAINKVIRR